jgi:uncharacterized membrane protein
MTYYLAFAGVVILAALAHILLKLGANNKKNWIQSFFNPQTFLGLITFILVTLLNLYALRAIELKYIASWYGLSYILVVFFSWKYLRERIDIFKILGVLFIAAGIFIFSFPF